MAVCVCVLVFTCEYLHSTLLSWEYKDLALYDSILKNDRLIPRTYRFTNIKSIDRTLQVVAPLRG